MLLATLVGIGAGLFEELGWTGFVIPTLLQRFGAVSTSLIVGIAWGAWHFLAIWWGSATSFGSVPVPLFLLAALFTFLPPYRVLMVRVYQRTGSLLIAILMHASLTASMIVLGPAVRGAESVIYNITFATMLWLAAAGILLLAQAPSVDEASTLVPSVGSNLAGASGRRLTTTAPHRSMTQSGAGS